MQGHKNKESFWMEGKVASGSGGGIPGSRGLSMKLEHS
jgi:hypothetical protein